MKTLDDEILTGDRASDFESALITGDWTLCYLRAAIDVLEGREQASEANLENLRDACRQFSHWIAMLEDHYHPEWPKASNWRNELERKPWKT